MKHTLVTFSLPHTHPSFTYSVFLSVHSGLVGKVFNQHWEEFLQEFLYTLSFQGGVGGWWQKKKNPRRKQNLNTPLALQTSVQPVCFPLKSQWYNLSSSQFMDKIGILKWGKKRWLCRCTFRYIQIQFPGDKWSIRN